MKNPVIFVSSFTSNIRRGRQTLAPQEAGVFRLYEKQAICTRRAWSVMGYATRAERLVFDSGRGKSLFVCPVNVKHHHAHRNHAAQSEAANSNAHKIEQGRYAHRKDAAQGGYHAEAQPRAPQTPGAISPPFTRFTLTPAFPPAAFSPHNFS